MSKAVAQRYNDDDAARTVLGRHYEAAFVTGTAGLRELRLAFRYLPAAPALVADARAVVLLVGDGEGRARGQGGEVELLRQWVRCGNDQAC